MRFMQIAKNAMEYELHKQVVTSQMVQQIQMQPHVPASWRQIKVETHRLNFIKRQCHRSSAAVACSSVARRRLRSASLCTIN